MKEISVIPFDVSMLDECIHLYQKVFAKAPWFENNDRMSIEQLFMNFHKNNAFIGYVARSGEDIVAVSIGLAKPYIKGLEYYIDQFFVDYELQGKGIGSLFLNEIKKDLIMKNIRAIMLLTEKQYPAFNFYIKNGFSNFEDMRFLGIGF